MKIEWNEQEDGTVVIDCQDMERLVITDQNFKKIIVTKESTIKSLALVDMPKLEVIECEKNLDKLYLKNNDSIESISGDGFSLHILGCQSKQLNILDMWEYCYISTAPALSAINVINLYVPIHRVGKVDVGNIFPYKLDRYHVISHAFLYQKADRKQQEIRCYSNKLGNRKIKLNPVLYNTQNYSKLVDEIINNNEESFINFKRWIFQRLWNKSYKKDLILMLKILRELAVNKYKIEQLIEIRKNIINNLKIYQKEGVLNISTNILFADFRLITAIYCDNSQDELHKKLNNAENETENIKLLLTDENNSIDIINLINKNLIPKNFMMKKIEFLAETSPFFKSIFEFINDTSLSYKHFVEQEKFYIRYLEDLNPNFEKKWRDRRFYEMKACSIEDLINILNLYKKDTRFRQAIAMLSAKLPSDSKIRKEAMKMIMKK